MENVIKYLADHPDECRYTDKAATAVVEEGLRCRAEGPDGATLISDMPKAIGGGGVARDWLQVVQGVVIAFIESPSTRCTSLVAGCCQAGNGWSLTASRRSNG